tara:strand:- start:3325 stop:4515 length:1191 start_codon:yes stop_codon:yes gene_type:complete
MRLILSTLLFLPSITFGVLSAEIFPWAIILSIFYVRKLAFSIALIILILLVSSFYSFYFYTTDTNISIDLMRSLATYLNVLFVSQYVLSLNKTQLFELIKLSKYFFFFLILIGTLQLFGSGYLDVLLKFFIPRGSGQMLSDSGRGATLLSTEPARAGIELTLIYMIYRLTLLKKSQFLVFDIFLLLFQLIVIKSASAVAFSLFFLGILNLSWRGLVFAPIIILAGLFAIDYAGEGRAANLLIDIYAMDEISTVLFFLINESGNRLLALYSFFNYGFQHLLGGGVGLWTITSMQAVVESGYDYTQLRYFDVVSNGALSPFRGPGVISNLMLDVGLLGTLLISYLFSQILPLEKRISKISFSVIIIFLGKIFLFGSPGNPIPFLALLLILRWNEAKAN